MTTNNTSAWKITHPEAVGLYVASVERRADTVRYWTGKHWTAPVMVYDMHLPGRLPREDWPAAGTDRGKTIEWLESVVVDAEGFISWGGSLGVSPLQRDVHVQVRFRQDDVAGPASVASRLRWNHIGGGGDIIAYRVVDNVLPLPETLPANDTRTASAGRRASDAKPSNPKDMVGVRKAPMSTVSAAVMAEVGVAMLEGALKYGRHNYRAVGVRSSVYFDGTLRHLFDWWEGTDIDPDSGMHHITKAITSLVVLRDAMIQGKCEDDRPPLSAAFYAELNARVEALMDKYADREPPRHYTIADSVDPAAA